MIGRARNSQIGAALLAAAVATGISAVGTAPAAHASCASFFGLSSSPDCKSSIGSIAIAIGSGAAASSAGFFGVAFAVGDQSTASSTANSVLSLAVALGNNSLARVNGLFTGALAAGTNAISRAGFDGNNPSSDPQFGNVAVNVANHPNVNNGAGASGFGSSAIVFGTAGGGALVNGVLNSGASVFGRGTIAFIDGGTLNSAFVLGGANTGAIAGPGPFAIAGSIGRTGSAIQQTSFGININGLAIPPAAGANPAAKQINRKSSAPKSTQPKAAKVSRKGSGHSAR